MNGEQNRGLDEMWPRVGAEIARARRREDLGRRISRWAIVASAAALAVTVAIVGQIRHARTGGQKPCECVPWDLTHIAPLGNVSAEYPLVCGKKVFAIRGEGRHERVVCVRKNSGKVEWESAITFSECRFACDSRRLYVLFREPLASWRCVALDVRDGTELWRRPPEEAGGVPPSMPTAVGDGVAWTRGNRVVLCAGDSGSTVWTRTTDSDDMLSAPRVQGKTVFAASRREVFAYRAASGDLLWRRSIGERQAGGRNPGLMELGEGRVYVAGRTFGGTGRISCLSAGTGAVLWSAPSDMPLRLQVVDGQVLVRSAALNALDAQDGALRWKAPVGGCGPISFGKERLYVVDAADRRELVAIDSRSGQMAWRRSAVGSCSGVVADRTMGFISGSDGILHAVALN